jgi:hypothetical protein
MTLSSTSMGWAAIVALAVGASQLIVAQDNAPVALQLQQRYGREHNERLSSCSLAIASLFSDTRARLLCTPRDGAGPASRKSKLHGGGVARISGIDYPRGDLWG